MEGRLRSVTQAYAEEAASPVSCRYLLVYEATQCQLPRNEQSHGFCGRKVTAYGRGTGLSRLSRLVHAVRTRRRRSSQWVKCPLRSTPSHPSLRRSVTVSGVCQTGRSRPRPRRTTIGTGLTVNASDCQTALARGIMSENICFPTGRAVAGIPRNGDS